MLRPISPHIQQRQSEYPLRLLHLRRRWSSASLLRWDTIEPGRPHCVCDLDVGARFKR
jgi:hypothetical protein